MQPNDIFSVLYPANQPETNAEPIKTEITVPNSAFPAETPLAMAYVPMQKFDSVLQPEAAFKVGTVFADLNKPFRPNGGLTNE